MNRLALRRRLVNSVMLTLTGVCTVVTISVLFGLTIVINGFARLMIIATTSKGSKRP